MSSPGRTCTMTCVNRWVEWARRIAAAPHAPVVTGVLLVLFAVAEALVQARDTRLPSLLGSVSESVQVGTAVPAITPQATGGGLYFVVFPMLALAATLPLLLLRGLPGAIVVTVTVVLSLTAFHTLTLAAATAQLISEYRLGRRGSPLAAVLLAAPFPVLALALASADPTGSGLAGSTGAGTAALQTATESVGGNPAWMLVLVLASMAPTAALAGIAQRAHAQALETAATRQVVADSLVEHSARGERARIARELHDVVAHHISMVAVQAETARLATPDLPKQGAERLAAIGDTARTALTEMRRVLGVLREDAEIDVADRRPQPGLRLHELNALLDEARDASGTVVRLILSGTPTVFDPGLELAAYRIIQEALTNARRHAPGAAVDVELAYLPSALRVRIRDNGPGPAVLPHDDPFDGPLATVWGATHIEGHYAPASTAADVSPARMARTDPGFTQTAQTGADSAQPAHADRDSPRTTRADISSARTSHDDLGSAGIAGTGQASAQTDHAEEAPAQTSRADHGSNGMARADLGFVHTASTEECPAGTAHASQWPGAMELAGRGSAGMAGGGVGYAPAPIVDEIYAQDFGGWRWFASFFGRSRRASTYEPGGLPLSGHGLSGMRERVAAVGGEFRAGPAPGGGFMIEAILPEAAE